MGEGMHATNGAIADSCREVGGGWVVRHGEAWQMGQASPALCGILPPHLLNQFSGSDEKKEYSEDHHPIGPASQEDFLTTEAAYVIGN